MINIITKQILTHKPYTFRISIDVSVAQGIERQPPELEVGGSNPLGYALKQRAICNLVRISKALLCRTP